MIKRVPLLAAAAILLALAIQTPAVAAHEIITFQVSNYMHHAVTVRLNPVICVDAAGGPVQIAAGARAKMDIAAAMAGRCGYSMTAKVEMRLDGAGNASAIVMWERMSRDDWRPFVLRESGMDVKELGHGRKRWLRVIRA